MYFSFVRVIYEHVDNCIVVKCGNFGQFMTENPIFYFLRCEMALFCYQFVTQIVNFSSQKLQTPDFVSIFIFTYKLKKLN